jgi:hypothetical protein
MQAQALDAFKHMHQMHSSTGIRCMEMHAYREVCVQSMYACQFVKHNPKFDELR